MIKRVRTWSKDTDVVNLIAKQKVDWSIFENGLHIPAEFHEDFFKANNEEIIPVGDSRKVELIIGQQSYRATLYHLNLASGERSALHLRYDGNKELKSLMKKEFSSSYAYLQNVRLNNSSEDSRKLASVPDEQAEYIEFFATSDPYRYEVKLITRSESHLVPANVWWVNQGTTLREEVKDGILWAPMIASDGRPRYHWDTMDKVQEGDIILHYANGALRFVSQAMGAASAQNKPESLGGSNNWGQAGRLLRTSYHPLNISIPLREFNEEIKALNIAQGPINSSGRVNQGYLFHFTLQGLATIQQLTPNVEWPDFARIITQSSDLEEQPAMEDMQVKERLENIKEYIIQRGFSYPEKLIENFYLSLKSKPFVILAGVSGTGKTKLVKLFAEALGATSHNGQYSLIPVRPDWSDPSDLIGFKDLNQHFRPGPLTEIIVEAQKPSNRDKPYFVCLDEMNLARVEHYFSDILSVIESQTWSDDHIVTDVIIRQESLVHASDIQKYGDLTLPDNLYIIGTVNMDETTHPFSKKVLDRANTIEFNYIRLDQYPNEIKKSIAAQDAPNSFLRSNYLQLVDAYDDTYKVLIEETTQQLVKINDTLESIHSHVGFRIRDSICFYLIYNDQTALMSRDEAFDLQLLQKILPRIQGSNTLIRKVLVQLLQMTLDRRLQDENRFDEDASELWNNAKKTMENAIYPQTARKILFMLRRLDEDGFTSYWLS